MLKKLITLLLAAAITVSALPVFASNTQSASTSISSYYEISLFDSGESADLFSLENEDTLYSYLAEAISDRQAADSACTVVVDNLSQFNIDLTISGGQLSDDANKLLTVYNKLLLEYAITSAKGECADSYILDKLTFEIDNSMTTDSAVAIMSEKALQRSMLSSFTYDNEKIPEIPVSLFRHNSAEILSKYQFSHPELCYIPSAAGVSAGAGYSQVGDVVNMETSSYLSVDYLPISYEEFTAFQSKLQAIIDEVIYPEMTDAQRAMALQDWIIDNTAYGYALGESLYPTSINPSENLVIYNIAEYDNLIDALQDEQLKRLRLYSHTAYAPSMLGFGVCQGYSMLYAALLNKIGIENGTYISQSMNHQWSLVKLDGLWYQTDVTWNDPTPSDEASESYNTISLSLTDGSMFNLNYQTEDFHYYSNLFMSDEKSIAENHTLNSDTDLIIPSDAVCTDNKFHAKQSDGDSVYSVYALEEVDYTKLTYCNVNKMYYYARDAVIDGTPTHLYYKLPFKLIGDDDTYILPVQVEKSEYDAVLNGTYTIPDSPDDEQVTVQIPDDTVINNTIDISCRIIGKEGDALTLENIGTAVIEITAKADLPQPSDAPARVTAYLVYYNENNAVIDITVQTAATNGTDTISFARTAPENAVAAKIIVLDADAELVPVIKALGTVVSKPSEPTAPDEPADDPIDPSEPKEPADDPTSPTDPIDPSGTEI